MGLSPLTAQVLSIPVEYLRPAEKIDTELSGEVQKGKLWVVYSEKENNKSYYNIRGRVKKDGIGFLEAFYVLKDQGEWLKVVKDPDLDFDGRLTDQAIEYGWMRKEDLLLWPHCLVNSKTQNSLKGIAVNTLESRHWSIKGEQSLFTSRVPDLSETTDTPINIFDFYFIYKKKGKAYLIGKNERIADSKSVKQNLIGWADQADLVSWDTQLAVEPNWDSLTISEAPDEVLSLALDVPTAQKLEDSPPEPQDPILMQIDKHSYRRSGEWLRFPLLEKNDNLLKVGVWGEIKGQGPEKKANNIQSNKKLIDLLDESEEKSSTINLTLVLDGAVQVRMYYPVIQQILQNIEEKLANVHPQLNIHYGLVIYSEHHRTPILEARSFNYSASINDFIETFQARRKASAYGPAALHAGLNKALSMIKANKRSINAVIVIGNCGDEDPEMSLQNEIIEKWTELDIHFLGIQISHQYKKNFLNFPTQLQKLLFKSTMNKYEQDIQNKKQTIKPSLYHDILSQNYKLNFHDIRAEIIYQDNMEVIKAATLQEEVLQFLDFVFDLSAKLSSTFNRHAEDLELKNQKALSSRFTEESVSSFSPFLMQYLEEEGSASIPLKKIKDHGAPFYLEAFAPLKKSGRKHPSFKIVLLMSRIELSEVIRNMTQLSKSLEGNPSETRSQLRERWKDLWGKKFLEQGTASLGNPLIRDLNQQVFGLPSSNPHIQNIRLEDITNEEAFPEKLLRAYLQEIAERTAKLNRIFNQNNYPYSFSKNDVTYYWIEENLIP
jgi:hypothetical protein